MSSVADAATVLQRAKHVFIVQPARPYFSDAKPAGWRMREIRRKRALGWRTSRKRLFAFARAAGCALFVQFIRRHAHFGVDEDREIDSSVCEPAAVAVFILSGPPRDEWFFDCAQTTERTKLPAPSSPLFPPPSPRATAGRRRRPENNSLRWLTALESLERASGRAETDDFLRLAGAAGVGAEFFVIDQKSVTCSAFCGRWLSGRSTIHPR